MATRILGFLITLAISCNAQSSSLSLSSGAAPVGGSVTLPLTLEAGNVRPAGLQWTLSYSPADVASITLAAGPAANAAGKALECRTTTGSSILCLLTGMNATTIANGVVATAAIQLSATPSSTTVPVSVTGGVSASPEGNAIPTTTTGGGIQVTTPTPSPSVLSGITCLSPYLAPGGTTTCTVTLTSAAQNNLTVTIADNNAQLTVPTTLSVPQGASSATFTAHAGTPTADGTAQITATLSGKMASTSIVLVSATLSAISCTPTTVARGAAATCTVTLSKAPSVNVDVALSSSLTTVQIPASVRINAGAVAAQFTATPSTSAVGTATLTATMGSLAKTVQLTVAAASVTVKALACTPSTLIGGTRTTCTVSLSGAAPSGGKTITLTSSVASVTVPATITIPATATSRTFTATASPILAAETVTVTASLESTTISTNIPLQQLKPVSFTCSPNPLKPGALLICNVGLNAAPVTTVVLVNTSSSAAIPVPAYSTVFAGKASARLTAYTQADVAAQVVHLTTMLGPAAITADITLAANVNTSAVSEISVRRAAIGESMRDAGLALANSTAPVIESVINAASSSSESICSPGGAATLVGTGLSSLDPGEVRVDINGESVPVLVASPSRVSFQCPDLPVGTPLKITLHNGTEVSNTIHTDVHEVTPGVFTIDGAGKGRGSVVLNGTAELALNAQDVKGTPALRGDIVNILCTGLGSTFGSDRNLAVLPIVLVDGISAEVLSAVAIENGVYQVDVRIPQAAPTGDAVPLEIQMPTMNGHMVSGNRVSISIAAGTRAE